MSELRSICHGAEIGYWEDSCPDKKYELIIIPICSECKLPTEVKEKERKLRRTNK